MYPTNPKPASNLRVFNACLLSFMILMAPIASVAASTHRVTTPPTSTSKITKPQLSAAEKLEAALFVPAPPVPPSITATKDDNETGSVLPGATITYDFNIANASGVDDATGVVLEDTIDPNTTLVGGSLKISPLAFADTYSATINTTLLVGAPGVLTNDTGTPTPTAVPIVAGLTANSGTVNLNANGSFDYTPPNASFTGPDTFTYTATNGFAPPSPGDAQAIVTINVDAPPKVTTTIPAPGAANVATNTNITLNFSESVNIAAGGLTLNCGAGNLAFTPALPQNGVSSIVIDPTADLPVGTACTVTGVAANIGDVDANDPPNQLDGNGDGTQGDNFTLTFTTDAPPTVSSTIPTAAATSVPANSNVTLNFSEAVDIAAGSITINCGAGDLSFTPALPQNGGSSIVLDPSTDFPNNTTCTVTAVATLVTDTDAGDPPNQLDGDNNGAEGGNFVLMFTTDAAPRVTSTIPGAAATQVGASTDITLNFSENVDISGGGLILNCGAGDLPFATGDLSDVPQVVINPDSDLPFNTACTVTATQAGVVDTDANDPPNQLDGDSNGTEGPNFTLTFTVDAEPTVTATTPSNGATGVANTTNIDVTFSEPVNATTSSFTIQCPTGSGNQAYALTNNGPQTIYTLNPDANLPTGALCTVTVIANQVSDTDAGDPPNNMAADYVFTFKIPPIANPDTYPQTVIGNVNINSANIPYSVTTNDVYASADPVTITKVQANTVVSSNTITATTAQGGTVVMTVSLADMGKFTYNPPVGYEGNDTFTYEITNGGGSATATVTIPIGGMVWFINNNTGGPACTTIVGGCGRLLSPFTDLASFHAVNNGGVGSTNPAVNDNIFIYESATAYNSTITLLTGQRLIGQDSTSSLSTLTGLNPPSGSAGFPAMNSGNATITKITTTAASTVGITLNSTGGGGSNTINGLTVGNTTSFGINGTTFGTLTVADVSINEPSSTRTGPALFLSTGTVAGSGFINVTSSGTVPANNVTLTTIAGTVNLGTGALSNATSSGLSVSGGISAGVNPNANINYAGTINNAGTGSAVSIASKNGGTVAISGLVTSTAGNGITLTNNNGATINFTGGMSLSTGANTAFTATGVGPAATTGGTINVTQNNTSIVNTLTTTTGGGLRILNTTIGSNGVTFRSISSNGGSTDGIAIDNTGTTAGLTVTGNGGTCTSVATCTGGAIQNKTGADGSTTQGSGIFLNNTVNPSFTRMQLNDFQNHAIRGTSVTGFTLDSSNITGTNGTNAAGGSREGNVHFDGLFTSASFPTVQITNSTLGGTSFSDGLRVFNTSGTLDRLTVNNVVFGNISSGGNDSLVTAGFNNGTVMKVTVTNSTFVNAIGSLTRFNTSNNSTLDVIFRQNKLSNNNVNQASGGGALSLQTDNVSSPTITYDISCNRFRDSIGIPVLVAYNNGGGTSNGSIVNNVVGVAGSGTLTGSTQASGIKFYAAGSGTHNIMIANNDVRRTNEGGIFIQNNNGSATVNATVFGNVTAEPGPFQFFGLNVDVGALGGDTSKVNVVVGSVGTAAQKNDFSAGDPGNFSDVNLSLIGAGQLNLSRNGSAGGTAAAVIDDNNLNPAATATGVSGVVTLVNTLPTTPPAVAACAVPAPLLFATGGIESAWNSAPLLSQFMGTSLYATPCASSDTIANSLEQNQLDSIVATAVDRWASTGLTDRQIASLRSIRFEVANLGSSYVGEAGDDRVLIDRQGSGKGWFVDSTPQDDSEFGQMSSATRRYTDPQSAPAGHLDLLTAVMHEMGHKLGLKDSASQKDRDSLMYGYLSVGERRTPIADQARGLQPGALKGTHYLSLARENRSRATIAKNSAAHRAKVPMPSGETVTAPIGTLPAGKSVNVQFQVTVNAGFSGASVSNQGTVKYDTLQSVLTDDPAVGGAADPTVTTVQSAPDANDDAYFTFKNTPLNIATPGVLGNDTGSPTVSAITGCLDVAAPFTGCATTAGGSVDVNGDGSFSYTPPSAIFIGPDTFEYTATNGSGSNNATVTITVNDTMAIYVNEVLFNPDATGNNEYLEFRGPASTMIPAGTYFVVVDGDTGTTEGDITTIINLSGLTFGSNGFLVLLQQGNTYTTAAGATVITGSTTGFGGLPGSIFTADLAATNLEDDSATFMVIQTGVAPTLVNDIDANDDATADGTVFASWSVRDSIGSLDGGSATDSGYGALTFVFGGNGEVTPPNTMAVVGFAPIYVGRLGDSTGSTNADWAATGALGGAAPNWTMGASPEPPGLANAPLDHIGSSNFINEAPVNSVPGAQAVGEDQTLTFNAANTNLISISDADAGTAAVKVTLTATNGTFSLSGTAGLTFTPGGPNNDGTNDTQMIFTGTIAAINTALDGLVFTPTPQFFSPPDATLTILTDDQGNTGIDGAKTDSDTINITVTGSNDPPSFTEGADQTVNEDAGPQTVVGWATNISAGPGESQTLTFNVSPTGSTGNLAFSSGPSINTATGNLTYTTSANTNGTATFDVTLSDNGGGTNTSPAQSFMITVNAVNDAPSFQIVSSPPAVGEDAGAQTVNTFATNFQPGPVTATDEGIQTLVSYTLTANGTTGNLAFTSGPAIDNAGTLTYTPTGNTSGTATFNVVATDSGSGVNPNVNQSAQVAFTITVTGQNDAPVLDNTGNMSLNPINENDVTNAGTLVTDIILSAGGDRITDVDAGAVEGIAVIAVDNTNGAWQYSINNGGLWTAFGSPGTATARLLASNATTRIRFVPNAGFSGTVNPGITFRAWDQTSGTNGATSDTTTNGNSTAFSTATETASITVNNGGTLQFSAATYTVAEAGGPGTLTVTRTGGTAGTATVNYAITGGTATAADYTGPSSGTLTFTDGDTAEPISIPIVSDSLDETDETLVLTLSSPGGTGQLGAQTTATLTITDDDAEPTLSIDDVSVTEGNAGTVNAVFTVTLSAASGKQVTVNYITANGSATEPSDYTAHPSTLLTFAVGETTKTITVVVKGDIDGEPDENYFINLSGANNSSITDNQGLGTIVNDDASVFTFSTAAYNTTESSGAAIITVNRTGDLTQAATVDYVSSDDSNPATMVTCATVGITASSRCDFITAIGTLRFAAGESSKTFEVLINQDSYAENPESLTLTLSNPTGGNGAILGVPAMATLLIDDDLVEPATNVIDDTPNFVREHYLDFLKRQPVGGEETVWVNLINGCPSGDTSCDRVTVSGSFFGSPEFQSKGYYATRFYYAAFGPTHDPTYLEFMKDLSRLNGATPAETNAARAAFPAEFFARTDFQLVYAGLSNADYVDALIANTGVAYSNRNQMVSDLDTAAKTRAQILGEIVDAVQFSTNAPTFNRAYVLAEYFGYLRRNPEMGGFNAWLNYLNANPGAFRTMVNGFVNSQEYRLRFGTP